MSVEDDLLKFAEGLRHEVLSQPAPARSAAPGLPAPPPSSRSRREDRFTDVMLDHLAEAGETENGILCPFDAEGMKVNAYAISDDGGCLDLFVSHCTQGVPPAALSAAELVKQLTRLRTFLARCLAGYHARLPKAWPAFDLAARIWVLGRRGGRFRLFLLTDCVSDVAEVPPGAVGKVSVSYQVWDVWRLFQRRTAGRQGEPIEIDFTELPGGPVQCLRGTPDGGPYECYLGYVPGPTLVAMYERFGPRLLERNVRTYLQARGAVNRGIRQTILSEPDMFLAYNNGLSATAERAEVREDGNGRDAHNGNGGSDGIGGAAVTLLRVTDFRIVNGGQTTGSLYHASRRDGADISGVRVPIKLTVLREPARVAAVVPRISQYANSQNRIDAADFSANDPFHLRVQELSRTVWAPAPGCAPDAASDGAAEVAMKGATEGGLEGTVEITRSPVAALSPGNEPNRQTKWYYERARGQYQDERSRQEGETRRLAWEQVYPPHQMFTKTELAKYDNTWNQLPHLVSRGAQKNFHEFTTRLAVRLGSRGTADVDEWYFRRLVAKAILFRRAEEVVAGLGFGAYRANVVTYTIASLAYVSAERIDLERVWKQQALPPGFADAIAKVAARVYRHLTSPPGNGSITDWCRREACWQDLKATFKVPARKVS